MPKHAAPSPSAPPSAPSPSAPPSAPSSASGKKSDDDKKVKFAGIEGRLVSEEELSSQYSDSGAEELDEDKDAAFNKTKKESKKGKRKVVNYITDESQMKNLQKEAAEIHEVIPRERDGKANQTFGATTIVCAVFQQKSDKTFKKFCFSNLSSLPPELSAKAEELQYHVITTAQGHAEVEMEDYLHARGQYIFVSMGCDKSHCVECQEILELLHPTGYDTQSPKAPSDSAVFKKFYISHHFRKKTKIDRTTVAEKRKLPIERHQNENKKARAMDKYDSPKTKKRKPSDTSAPHK